MGAVLRMDVVTFAVIVFFIAIEVVIGIVIFFLVAKGGLLQLMFLKLRGGSLVVRSHPDNTIDFKRYKDAPQTVVFSTKDKSGKKKDYTVQIARVKHTFRGTSNPIHFCPFNSQENISLNAKKQTAFSVQQWNEFAISNYEAGWNARGVLQQSKPWDIQHIQLILTAAIVCLLAFNFWLTYNVLATVGG